MQDLISRIQQTLQQENLDGWLMFDFRGRNEIANHILRRRQDQMGTRRWFYFIPATGEPVRICHRIESHALDDYPGRLVIYLSWQELHQALASALDGAERIAMEYSPQNQIPYISLADAGTVELIRSFGVEVVSSADLVQVFEAVWDEEQVELHFEAARRLMTIKDGAFNYVREALKHGRRVHEYEVQQWIWNEFERLGMIADHPPIVAVNERASDPHFAPTAENTREIRIGDVLLIDLWAKLNHPRGIYADSTWMAYAGETVPDKVQTIFQIVYEAQQRAFQLIKDRFEAGQAIFGWEADRAARAWITERGYGNYFIHRTGHSIGYEVHGNGCNLDDLETRDNRRLIPGTGFSIEPGIYLESFGVRSEIDVYLDPVKGPIITTAPWQTEVIALLGD